MSRQPRIWYPGAIYHVMSRGNHKAPIFATSEDYLIFLNTLCFIKQKYHFKVHSLCLMSNHFHLLIETSDISITNIMRHLLSAYTQHYNKANNCEGHLFQGRFTSRLIDDEEYFLEVIRYIHMNPVKAALAEKAEMYPYTSYREYLKTDYELVFPKSSLERLLNTVTDLNRIIDYFGNNKAKYVEFMQERILNQDTQVQIQLEMKEDEKGIPVGLTPIKT